MERFGFNINFKNTPEEILKLGESCLKTGLYHAIEVTYYENMQDIDTHMYNEAIRRIVKDYAPQVVVHISGFNTSEENSVLRSAILHEFQNCCKYAVELGSREIVMHCGQLKGGLHVPVVGPDGKAVPNGAYQRAWELSVQMFRICLDIAREYGITVHTENLNEDHLTVRCDTLVRFVEEVGRDNLDIVFDIGHCAHTGGNIVEDVLACGKLLKHLHLHDNCKDKDSHLPIGEGEIDYKAFCGALKEVGYEGLYMMELRHCEKENLESSREKVRACL